MEVFECEQLLSTHILVNTTTRLPGTAVGVECQDGYQLSGSNVLVCGYGGFWQGIIPTCRESMVPTTDSGHLLVIIIVAAATAAALVVLLCAIYMLCCNIHRKKQSKLPKDEPFVTSISDISHFCAITQDCVGMPPVTMESVNSKLKGRIPSEESPTQCRRQSLPSLEILDTSSLSDSGSDKIFIY